MEKGKAGIAAKERKQDNGHLYYNLNEISGKLNKSSNQ